MSVVINKYFIIYSPNQLPSESLPSFPAESLCTVDTVYTAEALANLVEKKVPAAIFLIQDCGKDPVGILNQLRTNATIDTVPIFAVNTLSDACKRMLEFC